MVTSVDRDDLADGGAAHFVAIIEAIREEGAYSLILDAASGSIVSADPALDLTQEVIARLQAADADGAGSGN